MAAVKNMREKMADEGLKSYIVSYDYADNDEAAVNDFTGVADDAMAMQFWAEDAGHAGDQFDDAEPGGRCLLVETQDEYEARTGTTLDYGLRPNC